MVLSRQAVATTALGLAAFASCSWKSSVVAFRGTPRGGAQRLPCETQSLAARQTTVGDTAAAKGHHRCYVRDRSGLKIALDKEHAAGGIESAKGAGTVWGAGTSGRHRRDTRSRVWMLPEDGATSSGEAVEAFMPAPLQGFLPESVQRDLAKINRDPTKLAFALNSIVLFLFATFAAFKLATVDGDIARGWTWYEILIRVPGDNFYRYEATVSENPIITKALTSCVAYGLGDLTAQVFLGKDLETIDLKRTARSASAGLVVHGPLCHYWIELMQTYLDFDGAWWNFIPKVIADQTVWSIFLNAAYSTMIMSLQGMSPENVWTEVRSTAWPALTSSWRFWPLIHCVSFSSFIPKDLKLLFIDCMEIIWVTILSTVANKDRKSDEEGAPPEKALTEAEASQPEGSLLSEPGLEKGAPLMEEEVDREAVHL